MSVRYNERTGVWDFDTVLEAKSFRDKLEQPRPTDVARTPGPAVKPAKNSPLMAELAVRVLPVLHAMVKAGDKGMLGSAISDLAGMKGPKGMAGFAASIEKYLKAVTGRADVKDLFWKDQKHAGTPAIWFVDSKKLQSLGVLDGSPNGGKA